MLMRKLAFAGLVASALGAMLIMTRGVTGQQLGTIEQPDAVEKKGDSPDLRGEPTAEFKKNDDKSRSSDANGSRPGNGAEGLGLPTADKKNADDLPVAGEPVPGPLPSKSNKGRGKSPGKAPLSRDPLTPFGSSPLPRGGGAPGMMPAAGNPMPGGGMGGMAPGAGPAMGMMDPNGMRGMPGMMSGQMMPPQASEDEQMEAWVTQSLGQYSRTEDQKERQAQRQEIAKALDRIFDIRQQRRMQELAGLEQRVEKLRGTLETRQKLKPEILKDRLEYLVREADGLGWGDGGSASSPSGQVGAGSGGNSFNPSFPKGPIFQNLDGSGRLPSVPSAEPATAPGKQ